MPRLYRRQVIVQLGSENAAGKEFSDLRVTFKIDMTDGGSPNEGKISVYNVSPQTVARMQADDAVIRLLVGYESEGAPRLLFQGNPITDGVKLEVSGTDRVLVVEAQDGGRAYTSGHISESYGTATTSAQVFAALADAIGLPLGNVDAVVGDVSFPHGLALSGPVRNQLDRVAEMSGARWTIRDGALQVWLKGETTGEESVVFSVATGNLVGSPTITDTGVEIKALLAPTLRPGKPFRVQSREVNGDFVATEVSFSGDTGYSTDFYVTAKGTPL